MAAYADGAVRPIRILACGVFERELQHLAAALPGAFEVELLDAGLHSRPDELRQRLQEAIDATPAERYRAVGLVYGMCGRAAVGLTARELPVILPRVHDCIALFLGSTEAYREQFRTCPGTLWLTPGWCEKEAHPDQQRLDAARHEWSATLHPDFGAWSDRYGEGNARWIVEFLTSWRQHYQRVAFISHPLPGVDIEPWRRQARELAAATRWRFEEVPGELKYVAALVAGEEDPERFLVVPPHHRVVGTNDARLMAAVPPQAEAAPTATTGRTVIGGPVADAAPGARLGLGVDAGGTFTDAVLLDLDRGTVLAKAKAPTVPHDLAHSIEGAVAGLAAARLAEVDLVALSTTLATNAIVEGRGARVGLLLMPWNAKSLDQIQTRPTRIVPGRLNIDGIEVDPVDAEAVQTAVRELLADGCEAFAVSGYAGTHNPAHERQVAELVRELTDLPVVCGHELSGKLDFIRRAHTAVLNARLLPIVSDLMAAVEAGLGRFGIHAPLFVVRGDGSLVEVSAAKARPIETILSGPAASAGGAKFLTGQDDVLAVDIGGTTTDIAIVQGGRVAVAEGGPTVGTWRTAVTAVDIQTSGLGGDSAIAFGEGGSKITFGPTRATPLCALASRFAPVAAELAEIDARGELEHLSPPAIEFFELVHLRPRLQLTDREWAILDILDRGPASRYTLAGAIGAVSIHTLGTERLEGLGVIRRGALTPTDLLHLLGRLDRYAGEASQHALNVVARFCGERPEALVGRLHEQFVRRLAWQVARRELAAELGDPDHGDELLTRLLERMLSGEQAGQPFAVRFHERRLVVGIGAPAAAYLPEAGRLLDATVLVPEHAEVANAIGAITGKVTIRATVQIRPDLDGSFLLVSPLGRGVYADLQAAQDAATELLVRHLRERAGSYGTDERQVTVDVVARTGRLSDGSDTLVKVVVEGILEGAPRVTA